MDKPKFDLKPLSPNAISAALEKANRYRLLNEPRDAESICLDVLAVDANNRDARITLILACTDQFDEHLVEKHREAREALDAVNDDYARAYYGGVICERRAKASLAHGVPGAGYVAYDWFRQAMELYEKAASMKPSGDDAAVLRWNSCARIINSDSDVCPEPEVEAGQPLFSGGDSFGAE